MSNSEREFAKIFVKKTKLGLDCERDARSLAFLGIEPSTALHLRGNLFRNHLLSDNKHYIDTHPPSQSLVEK